MGYYSFSRDDLFEISIVNNKIVLEVKQAAIDKGPYAIIISPTAEQLFTMQGSIAINFDVTKKKSTAFTYEGGSTIVLEKDKAVSKAVELTAGAEHPVEDDKKGTFTVYPDNY